MKIMKGKTLIKNVGAGFHACPNETSEKYKNKNIVADAPVCQNERGITLIALVITIIVLLILAGVTISMVVGDNGILTRAKQAKFQQMKAETESTLQIALAELSIDIEEARLEGIKTVEENGSEYSYIYSKGDMLKCFENNLNNILVDSTGETGWLITAGNSSINSDTCDDEDAYDPIIPEDTGTVTLYFKYESPALKNAAKSEWSNGDGLLKYKVEIVNWKVGQIENADGADNTGGY